MYHIDQVLFTEGDGEALMWAVEGEIAGVMRA